MKVLILRACGHEERITICGPHKDRERRIEYEQTKVCYECYKARKAAEADAAKAEAKDFIRRLELPELEGSEKQVEWAASIRLRRVIELLDWLRENHVDKEAFLIEWGKGEGGQFAHIVRGLTNADATAWINGRFEPFEDLEFVWRPKTKTGHVAIGPGWMRWKK